MNDDIAIRVQNVSKTFRLPHEKQASIKGALINFSKRGYEKQQALDNISFEVKKGDFFGIVGRNGSGKSTLLKILAGIYSPSRGSVEINGKLTPFIELGVGFSPELTGRENVYLNGALLGFSRKEMEAMYKDIVEFAELERFMDQKLKNYSSGMQVRLAFSIAIRAKGDMLLLDEVLAVGDSNFQKKCFDYFYELKREKRTVVFVSHDMEAVQRFCNKAVWIDGGELKASGITQDVTELYKIHAFEEGKKPGSRQTQSEKVAGLKVSIAGKKIYKHTDKLKLRLNYDLLSRQNTELRLAIIKDGIAFTHISTKGTSLASKAGKYSAELEISLGAFMEGEHSITWGVFDADTEQELAFKTNAESFYVGDKDPVRNGFMRLDSSWTKLPTSKN